MRNGLINVSMVILSQRICVKEWDGKIGRMKNQKQNTPLCQIKKNSIKTKPFSCTKLDTKNHSLKKNLSACPIKNKLTVFYTAITSVCLHCFAIIFIVSVRFAFISRFISNISTSQVNASLRMRLSDRLVTVWFTEKTIVWISLTITTWCLT